MGIIDGLRKREGSGGRGREGGRQGSCNIYLFEKRLAATGPFLKMLGQVRLGWVKGKKAAGALLAMLIRKYLST